MKLHGFRDVFPRWGFDWSHLSTHSLPNPRFCDLPLSSRSATSSLPRLCVYQHNDNYRRMYGQHFQQIMDQQGMVSNPARGQVKRKNDLCSCPRSRLEIWCRETGSALPSRLSALILHTRAESGAYSRHFFCFARRRLHMPPTAIVSVSSLSGHVNAYRWRSLPRTHPYRANSPCGSSSYGCFYFSSHH